MARPTHPRIRFSPLTFYSYWVVLLGSQLITSFVPLSLLAIEFEFLAIAGNSWAAPDGDDYDEPRDETAQLSERLARSLSAASHLAVTSRRRFVRRAPLLSSDERLEKLQEPLLRIALVFVRAHPLPPSPGSEHSHRNGIGAPLRC